jgi:hypothetical protein
VPTVNTELWDYLETDWLDGAAVDILNRDRESLMRRLRSMAEELETQDIRQEILK